MNTIVLVFLIEVFIHRKAVKHDLSSNKLINNKCFPYCAVHGKLRQYNTRQGRYNAAWELPTQQ